MFFVFGCAADVGGPARRTRRGKGPGGAEYVPLSYQRLYGRAPDDRTSTDGEGRVTLLPDYVWAHQGWVTSIRPPRSRQRRARVSIGAERYDEGNSFEIALTHGLTPRVAPTQQVAVGRRPRHPLLLRSPPTYALPPRKADLHRPEAGGTEHVGARRVRQLPQPVLWRGFGISSRAALGRACDHNHESESAATQMPAAERVHRRKRSQEGAPQEAFLKVDGWIPCHGTELWMGWHVN
eukprot:190945-Chlamydomonas_euryale.AAC.2